MNPLSRFFHRRKALRRPFDWKNGREFRGSTDRPARSDMVHAVIASDGSLRSIPSLTETAAVHPYFIEESDDTRSAA